MTELPAQLTIKTAHAEAQRLAAAVASDPVLDASALVHFDSAALAVLLQCRRAAAASGRALQVVSAPAKLQELAALYGVAGLLGLGD